MPRLYLTNDSYPELREIDAQWSRTRTWWRAIGHAIRHIDFWIFALTQLGLVIGIVLGGIGIAAVAGLDGASGRIVHLSFAIGALLVFCYLQISWGGDMMRRHLRAVSDVARYACPQCGQSLFGHLGGNEATVRCPECGSVFTRKTFEPPYPIPHDLRAFPPWAGS